MCLINVVMHPSSQQLQELSNDLLEGFLLHLNHSMLVSTKPDTRSAFYEIQPSMSLKFNAEVSWPGNGPLLYLFNWGTCLSLCDAAMTLASLPEFYKAIACDSFASTSVNDGPLVRCRFGDYTPIDEQIEESFIFPLKRYTEDPKRQHLGNVLFELAAKFVSLHEQGHALHGHLHYMANRGSRKFYWCEFDEEAAHAVNADPESLTVQALELQADGFACEFLFQILLRSGAGALFPESPLFIEGDDSAENWLFFCYLAATMVYCILEKVDTHRNSALSSRRHPPARVRLLGCIASFRRQLIVAIPDETRRERFLSNLHREMYTIFRLIGADPLEREAFIEYFSVPRDELVHPTSRYLDKLIRHLESLGSELSVYIQAANKVFR